MIRRRVHQSRVLVAALFALAVAAFVLPFLTVEQERVGTATGLELVTGAGRFSGRSATALMDLGAPGCVARVPRCGACPLAADCPSRGRRYEPLRKQAPLAGSFRERRARVLRLVAEASQRLDELDREAVDALAHDGLVEVAGEIVSLPE